jgi:transmembrane sensor
LRLADGSQVMLAPNSVLRRPSDYNERERRLELEGRAYFTVTHDSTRPFTVHTAGVVVYDLGTRFDVSAYPDGHTDVLVADGKVEVASAPAAQPVRLEVGQRARLDARGGLAVRSGVDLARALAWTEGKLVFSDTPLGDVKRQIERWYDVDVRLATAELGALRVTGTFDDEPVTLVLESVAQSLGLDLVRSGDGYRLSRAGP